MKNKVLKIQNLKKYLYVKKVFEDIKTYDTRTRTFYDIYGSNVSHFFYNFYSICACADTWPTKSTFCKIAISVLFACYLHTITQHIILKQSDVEKLSKFLCFLKLTPNAFLLILKEWPHLLLAEVPQVPRCRRGVLPPSAGTKCSPVTLVLTLSSVGTLDLWRPFFLQFIHILSIYIVL